MPQTFYIENDEEIISVIGRLRRSSGQENYFIFPKRSLVLQSTINLQLFQREAQKLGKKIVIVTQDETGLALANKIGLKTEHYTDDFSQKNTHLELKTSMQTNESQKEELRIDAKEIHTAKDLGSNDFYVPANTATFETTKKEERTLRVRNASPIKQTSLNSKRNDVFPQKITQTFMPDLSLSERAPEPVYKQEEILNNNRVISHGREDRLKNFFSPEKDTISQKQELPVTLKREAVEVPHTPKKVGGILLFFGGISVLSFIGVLIFLFLPRAEIHVVPYKMTTDADLQFEGRFEGVLSDEDTLLVRLAEQEQEVTFSADATGLSTGTAQKARGLVLISNTYSTEPQPLVATTRLESPEGKIFRLIEGVIVPGMVNGNPGTIEASVIADQTGTEYNIAGTKFTIPGFKGSQKFEKFSAQSNKAMTGGSQATGSGSKVISKDDLDKAEIQAKQKAKEAFMASLSQNLASGERILEENLEITSEIDSSTLPITGTVATSFEYKNTFKIRGIIFSEAIIKEKIFAQGEQSINDVMFRPTSVSLSYGETVPNYAEKKVRLKVHAIVDSESVIDSDKLLHDLLGKNSDEVNDILTSYPAIKKIEIAFKPQWFTSVVPSAISRVTVFIEPGSSE